ncbi:MAG: O-antigen ligase family protein [Methyloprofundus sp.]|nr:O-antigen ligase family protein [Methyloprofundus sp.]
MSLQTITVNSLFFIIPGFILVVPGAGEASFVIISLWSMIYCYKEKINPFKYNATKSFSFILFGYFVISFLSVIASDPSLYAFRRLGTNFHFLVAPWLAVFLLNRLKVPILSNGIKVGAILAGIVALVQYFYLGTRAGGVVNEILFGDIALLLAFFSLINFFHESTKEKTLSIISFSLGLTAVILSLSRGAWITAPILFIVLIFIWTQQKAISIKNLMLICMIAMGIVIAAGLTPQVQSRFQTMNNQIMNYKDNDFSSVGARITLWKAALHVFPNHPIIGYGLHNTKLAASDFFQDVQLKKNISYYDHFHNEYLNTLVGKGLVGLFGLLALFLVPIRLFYKNINSGNKSNFAGIGIILCTGYIFFGLTNITFGHGIFNTFFVFILTACSSASSCILSRSSQ